MVILFRPYLLDQKTEKSYNNSDPNVTTINPDIALVCQWIGCNRAFENLDMLSNHVAKEHANPRKDGMFYCGWKDCNRGDKGFNARYKMLVHVRTHTNEKPHHCYQCNKSFSRAENLKIHSRSHTGEKPYVCTVPGCGKAYSNSSDRFKHSRTHAVDKPYACKVPGCPKRYTDPSSLRKHVKTYKHYPVTVSNGLKEEQVDKKSCIVNERLTPMKEEVPINEFKLGFNKILCDETKVKLSVMSYLPAYHFNEIYLWHQSNGLQVYNSPLSIGSNFDKCVNMDEPLDLRINCD